jgi:primosomal protein N' (replication factor Y)
MSADAAGFALEAPRAARPPGAAGRRVSVLLPLPLSTAYDYRLPPDVPAGPGSFVEVPLGGRVALGVIWDPPENPDAVAESRLREVLAVKPAPPMTPSLRRFIDWVAQYTLAPPGAVLRMAMSSPSALDEPAASAGWRAVSPPPAKVRLSAERLRALEALGDGILPGTEIARRAGVLPGVIRGMANSGLIAPALLPRALAFPRPDPGHAATAFEPAQGSAAAFLGQMVGKRHFEVALLQGVTGSGKTEVYLEAIAECLRQGRQALVLLPEIALSTQWLSRFEKRFGAPPALWHSELSSRTRRVTWRAVADGEAPVLVGARSALFLPFPDLGLVVVDEEHETAFKQEDGVIYNARDMAVVRARLSHAAAALVSATPSLETVTNAEAGRYARCSCPRATAARRCPESGHRPARHAAGARALPVAAAHRGHSGDAGPRRAGDAVS